MLKVGSLKIERNCTLYSFVIINVVYFNIRWGREMINVTT
jgi:hypothetical protein